MGSLGFTLADRLGAKSLPCSVPGCARTWISMAAAGGNKNGKGLASLKLGGRGAASPDDPASSMCDPCRDKLAKTRDQERACDRPGCAGTWTWPVAAQMAAFANKRPAPQGLCGDCEQKLAALEDKPVPCAVPGCTRTSVLTARSQLLAGAPDVEVTAAATMCGPCDGVFQKLKDRQVGCGINGCKNKWAWSKDEQIQAYAQGLNNEPPRRMCEECRIAFGGISDREVRCRASGCKITWVWSRSDQLDACLAGKPTPKAPHRMCERCHGIYQTLKDVERACRRAGCKGTWLDKRGAQLARAVRGKTGEPYPQYCESCEKELGDLEDRQIACKTDNCTGTWTWTTLNRNGQPQQDKLTLAIAKDGTLTGTLADRSGTSAITKASFSNGLLQFSVIHVTPNAKLETTYTGQLTGNTLSLSSQRPDPAPAAAAQNKKRTADIVATLIPANEVKPVVPLPKLGGG